MRQRVLEMPRQGGDPVELVEVLPASGRHAVREVAADEPDRFPLASRYKCGGHEALVVVGKVGKSEKHILGRQENIAFRKERNSVVGFLACEDDVIARLSDGFGGEYVVGELRLLQDDRVDA